MSAALVFLLVLLPAQCWGFSPDVFTRASSATGIPVELILAVSHVESGFHPSAINVAGRSFQPSSRYEAEWVLKRSGDNVDIGLMQINWGHWGKKFGLSKSDLLDPWLNVLLGARILARAYVAWSRQASEKLAKASEYIAQATREINSEATAFRNDAEKSNDVGFAGQGPAGLYYFFSPGDESAVKDVAVLNKIWREGRLGVVGIPVRGKDEQIVNYVNEAKPLFPIRRSDAEVKLVRAAETPNLYLALPLEKKLFRLGPTITETAIADAISTIAAELSRIKSRM